MDAIKNAPSRELENDLAKAFNNDYDSIKSAKETMLELSPKMENQTILTGDEIERFNQAKATLNAHSNLVNNAKENGIDVNKSLKGISGFDDYNQAMSTGFNSYEVQGSNYRGLQYFSKIKEEVEKPTVGSYLSRLDEIGPIANTNLDANYLKENEVSFGMDSIDNLIELKKKNVTLDSDADNIVKSALKIKASGVGADSEAYTHLHNAASAYDGTFSNLDKEHLSLFNNNVDGSMNAKVVDGKIVVGQENRNALKGLLSETELNDDEVKGFLETGEITKGIDISRYNKRLVNHSDTQSMISEYNLANGTDYEKITDMTEEFKKGVDSLNNLVDGGSKGSTVLEQTESIFTGVLNGDEAENLHKKIASGAKMEDFTSKEIGAVAGISRVKTNPVAGEFLEKMSDEGLDKIINNNYRGELENITKRADKVKHVADILGIGDGSTGAYSFGKDVRMKTINDKVGVNGLVDKVNGSDDMEIMNEVLEVKQSKSPWKNGIEARQYAKANPERAKEVLDQRIALAMQGNLDEELTKVNVSNALNDGVKFGKVAEALLEKDTQNPKGSIKEAFNEKFKKISGNLSNENIDVNKLKGVAEETTENLKHISGHTEILGSAGKFLKGSGGKLIGLAAAGLAIGGISSVVSSAQQERERKEQQLAQLMIAQNSSSRGMY